VDSKNKGAKMKNTIYTAESYGEFMKEQLVSFETALLAKLRRFTITECFYGISSSMIYDANKKAKPSYQNTQEDEVDAPTQSLLQKWLREKHKISLLIYDCFEEGFGFQISKLHTNNTTQDDNSFNTYEEALEQGLQEALKLI